MKKILFVCLGNICRSPAAEAVMQHRIEQEGLTTELSCDSAGTSGYHVGEPADARMQRHAHARGYDVTSISRQFDKQTDFEAFDLIVTMDEQNYAAVREQATSEEQRQKVHRFTDFCKQFRGNEVPDPYYGGDQGFEDVLDMLADGCSVLLEELKKSPITSD